MADKEKNDQADEDSGLTAQLESEKRTAKLEKNMELSDNSLRSIDPSIQAVKSKPWNPPTEEK